MQPGAGCEQGLGMGRLLMQRQHQPRACACTRGVFRLVPRMMKDYRSSSPSSRVQFLVLVCTEHFFDAKLIYSCSAVRREGCGILHLQSFICWMKIGPSLKQIHSRHSLQSGFRGICPYLTAELPAADGLHPPVINWKQSRPVLPCAGPGMLLFSLSHSSVCTVSRFSLV